MGIDLQHESIVSFAEAARFLPQISGKRLHTSTIWRWARRGLRGVTLEHAWLGGRVFTSKEALTRFVNKLADAEPPLQRQLVKTSVATPCATSRATSIENSNAALERDGI